MNFKCYICSEKFHTLDITINHLKIIHMIKDNFHQIKCIVDTNCDREYASFKALRAHVKSCINSIKIDAINSKSSEINEDNEILGQVIPEHHEFVVPRIDVLGPTPANSSEFVFGEKRTDENIDEFIDSIISDIIMLNLNNKATDAVFKLCEKLVKNLNKFRFGNRNFDSMSEYVSAKLHSMNSHQKREKFFNNIENFIKPDEKAIGLRWEMKKDSASGLHLPTQIQSKFQFVSVVKTLISFFDQEEFKQLYMNYNLNNSSVPDISRKHVCEPGLYRDFCCGKIFKDNELFKMNPESIQLQFFVDGFDPCDALKSRANVHSQVGIYFTIRNLPHRYAFSQNNIHLAAMCHANDLKTKHTDYNDLWKEIVKEISFLERTGIVLDSENTLKGNI